MIDQFFIDDLTSHHLYQFIINGGVFISYIMLDQGIHVEASSQGQEGFSISNLLVVGHFVSEIS